MTDLTESERKLLDIFGKPWAYSGAKETAIREATGLSAVAATQRVNQLIDTEAALAYAPLTTKRLLRLREQRKVTRRRVAH